MLAIVASDLISLNSCGTIAGAITKGKRPAFIVNAQQDVVVKQDGKALDIDLELFASTEGYNQSTNYYTSAVNLPYKKTLTL